MSESRRCPVILKDYASFIPIPEKDLASFQGGMLTVGNQGGEEYYDFRGVFFPGSNFHLALIFLEQ